MPLYFVRHGQTDANVQHLYDGQDLNSPLNKTGRQQAAQLVETLRPLHIQKFISSPLDRARETAEIITKNLDFNGPIQFDDRLMEGSKGILSGTHYYQELSWVEIESFEGVERAEHFQARVKAALAEAVRTTETTLIVSHGGVFGMYMTLHDRLPAADFWSIPSPENASVTKLDINWQ